MPVGLFEGHFRSLEKSLILLVDKLKKKASKKIAIIAAGRAQLEHIQDIILAEDINSVLAGIEFFPGFFSLALKFSSTVFDSGNVSEPDRIAFSLEAMKSLHQGQPFHNLKLNISTASSLGNFFERLLEEGITSEMYATSEMMLKHKATSTEKVTGVIFQRYEELRNSNYPDTADLIVAKCQKPSRYDNLIIYGYYDLNPLQRSFLRKLIDSESGVYFFNPIHRSSFWQNVARRTHDLIYAEGVQAVRPDIQIPQGEFRLFAESMFTGKKTGIPDNFKVSSCSGYLGLARTVLKKIKELSEGPESIPLNRIAVVERSTGTSPIVRLACHEGVPIASPLIIPLSDLPAAKLVITLLKMGGEDFHHTSIRKAVLTGCVAVGFDPADSSITSAVEETGVRFGVENWKKADGSASDKYPELFNLIESVRNMLEALPDQTTPAQYLKLAEPFIRSLLSCEISAEITDTLFDNEAFRCNRKTDLKGFIDLLLTRYEKTQIKLCEPDPEGFNILSPEQIRGCFYDVVIFTGLQEGLFPATVREDPRLSDDLRKLLQLPLLHERVKEEAFLFLQVLEACSKHAIIIFMDSDSSGKPLQISQFVDDLKRIMGVSVQHENSSPFEVLLGGDTAVQKASRKASEAETASSLPLHLPFFYEAWSSERSRMSDAGFDNYDGILGGNIVSDPGVYSATSLEEYRRCPFRYLISRIWNLKERSELGVSSEPDALFRGNFLHEVIERLIQKNGFSTGKQEIRETLEKTAESLGLDKILGNPALCEVFIENEIPVVEKFLSGLSTTGWNFDSREKELSGFIGSVPVRGRLDLILIEKDRSAVVLDLKTGSILSRSQVESGIRKGTVFQVPLYFELADQNNLNPSLAGYVYIKNQEERGENPLFNRKEMTELLPGVNECVKECVLHIKKGFFPPIPGDSRVCKFCCFRSLCRITPLQRIEWKLEQDHRFDFHCEKGSRDDD